MKLLQDNSIKPIILVGLFFCVFSQSINSQLVISEIAPNSLIEGMEQYESAEWFEVCNVGETDMDISGYTIGHYEDASFQQSDFYLNGDNCDCGGSYGVVKLNGSFQSNDVILPSGECLIITGDAVDCTGAYYCINARNMMLHGPSGIVQSYHSSRTDFPGSGIGNGRGALNGHYWRQKNYECNAFFIWNANDVIIDAVNFNCLPQTGPDASVKKSGGFHYPNGQGGYYTYPPAFPTPPADGPFPLGVEINENYVWVGESIEEGFTYQRCRNNPSYVFPPMKYDASGNPSDNYYPPTCGQLNEECCSDCDNNDFFQGIQLPNCSNGSAIGLVIEENEQMAEMEILTASAPTCNNNESRLRSNYNENEISFCTKVKTPADFDKPYIGFVNSLEERINVSECSNFMGADIFHTIDCDDTNIPKIMSSQGRTIFKIQPDVEYTLCFNYDISACDYKNRVYWENPCFSPFYCALEVNCPTIIQDTVNCLADVPSPEIDSTGFVNNLGGEILTTCSAIMISSYDSLGQVSGPKNQKILFRKYILSDGLDTVSCTVEYYIINRINPILALAIDTVYLQADGMLTLTSENVIEQAHDICGDTIKDLVINPFLLDADDLGTTEIYVEITDSADNVTFDYVDIIVLDNTPPAINCPNDTVIVVLPCMCENTFVFSEPETIDENGGVVIITRIDSTGLQSGDLFPVGTTTIVYEAEDESGNVTICSYDVTIQSMDPGPIILKAQINFSLSETCNGYPTPSMVHEGTPACPSDNYVLKILDQNGNFVPEDSLRNYINQVLTVELSYACYDNSATMDILIEDKYAPQLICLSDTVTCGEFFNIGIPVVTDNCDQAPTLILLNETLQNVSCTDPNLSRIIRRTYTSIDENGQRSDTCFQVLSVAKFDLSTVGFLGQDTLIYCGNITDIDANGHPSPAITGYPIAGNQSLWPNQDAYCGVMTTYEDILIPGTSCGYSIARIWTVMYWDCFQDGMRQFFQTINITDNQAPVFTCLNDITLNTEAFSCSAFLSLNLPIALDGCNNGVRFDITYPDGLVLDASSITRTLELGVNEIIITTTDMCGNASSCSFEVTVEDNDNPIAIVNGSFEVDLSGGTAVISALELDNDSFDECGPVSLTIARMTTTCDSSDLLFSPEITVCCADIDTEVMVQFLVTDQSGNTSMAMILVIVNDITPPSFIADFPDISVSCDFLYPAGNTNLFGKVATNQFDRDTIILMADSSVFSGLALDALVIDNCAMSITEEVFDENLNTLCGLGTIQRMFTVTDNSGNSVTLDQNITFFNPFPLVNSDINWPNDFVENNICDPSELAPENLTAPFNMPFINSDVCDSPATSPIDDIDYGPFESDTLFVINRQWTVVDWCQNVNGQFVRFDSTQLIVVLNNIEPEIYAGCDPIAECNTSSTCADFLIALSISASDDCSPSNLLNYSYQVDFNNDLIIDLTGNGASANIDFPIGNHVVLWTVSDPQGNPTMCAQEITIDNCVLPSPVCLLNQEFALIAVDTDNDGSLDDEQITIQALEIDGGSSNACGPFILSFSENVSHVDTTFNCDNLGNITLQLYVTDPITGNQDFCETSISIIDTNSTNICAPISPIFVTISGEVKSEMQKPTEGASIRLIGTDLESNTVNGNYIFPAMSPGGNYSIQAEFDTYPLDGVTTLDILLIQKHLLGIELLDSPYKLLAADINNSGSINGADIIGIRKLLLGSKIGFDNQANWQFVPKNHLFIDAAEPWINNETIFEIPVLEKDIKADFIAIKTGDVNNSSINVSNEQAIVRSFSTMKYELIEQENELIIPVYMEDLSEIEGFQFSFRYDYKNYSLKEIMDGAISLTDESYGTKNADLGVIDISWVSFEKRANMDFKNEVAFYIILQKTTNNNQLSNPMIQVFSEGLASQAYYNNGQISALELEPRSEENQEIKLFQNKPNPFKNNTLIGFYLPETQFAKLSIFDLTGRVLYEYSEIFKAGMNEINITSEKLNFAGIYYYTLTTDSSKEMKKMILIK